MTPLLLLTMLGLVPTAERVSVECSTSSEAAGLAPGASDVTAIRCSDRDGFWIPSSRYRQLRNVEIDLTLHRAISNTMQQEIDALQVASNAWAKTASAATSRAMIYRSAADAAYKAQLDADDRATGSRSWLDHPGLWFGAGALTTILSVWALGHYVVPR